LPYQDKAVIPYSLTACDVSLVSIEQGMEGLVVPSKLYGSLAAGRPIAAVCEPHSYLRQILTDGQCGQAFNNGDSAGLAAFLRSLAQDPQRAIQMGTNGRYYLQHYFTPQHSAQLYLRVIQRCVQIARDRQGHRHQNVNFQTLVPQPQRLPISSPLGADIQPLDHNRTGVKPRSRFNDSL